MRCRDLVWHLTDQLHDLSSHDRIAEWQADAIRGSPAAPVFDDSGPATAVAPRPVAHAAERRGMPDGHDAPVAAHQRAVENRERMRQAPRNQKRMPRTRKEASR